MAACKSATVWAPVHAARTEADRRRDDEAVLGAYAPEFDWSLGRRVIRALLIRNQRQWGRSTGIEAEMPPYGMVFTIRGGKVVRWRIFPDHESALEAAGLSE